MKLAIDANVLVEELLRKRGRDLIANPVLTLYVTERVLDEAQYELRRRLTAMVGQGRASDVDRENLLELARHIVENNITLVAESNYTHLETEARNRIPRDPDDWPTVALALEMEAAIWTQDCDFLGCGCPSWTTETLLIKMRTNTEGN